MDEVKQFRFAPRSIVRNSTSGDNGELEDCINLRYRDGALRPVPQGKKKYNKPIYDKIAIHKTAEFEHYIGWLNEFNLNTPPDPENLKAVANYFNPSSGAVIQTFFISDIEGESVVDIKPFKNYVLISTSLRLIRCLWSSNAYVVLNIQDQPRATVTPYDIVSEETEVTTNPPTYTDNEYDCSAELKGLIYKLLNEQSADDSRISGAISWVAAIKLTDGSYILQTTPVIQQSSQIVDDNNPTTEVSGGVNAWYCVSRPNTDSGNQGRAALINLSKWKVTLNKSDFSDLSEEEPIIQSICVFFSKPLLKWDIEETITNEFLSFSDATGSFRYLRVENKLTEDWQEIGSPKLGWFKVCDIPINKVLESETSVIDGTEYMDMDNFYQNYATKEALPVDQLTHYPIKVDDIFIYNSRLWTIGLSRQIVQPYAINNNFGLNIDNYSKESINAVLKIKLKIDSETKEICSEIFPLTAYINSGDDIYIQLPPIAYPDGRATEFTLYIQIGPSWYVYLNKTMTVSTTHNYSFYFDANNDMEGVSDYYTHIFFGIEKNLDDLAVINPSTFVYSAEDNSLSSQVQLSALNNPFLFPSALNYTVGTGEVQSFAVMVDALSEGQFGSYPVICFTSEGLYALELGSGSVVVANVTPVSTDIATGIPLGTSKGIFFPTRRGIMLLEGRKVTNISLPLDGVISRLIQSDNAHMALYSNHVGVSSLGTVVTDLIEFKYLLATNTVMGWDAFDERVILCNSNLGWSYVFDLKSASWHRITESYDYFVTLRGSLLGIADRGIIDLSDWTDTTNVQVHFHTNILSLNANTRKKLEQTLMNCSLQVMNSKYAALMLFASNDGMKWTRITGNDRKGGWVNDIMIPHSQSSCKFFMISFWADLKITHNETPENVYTNEIIDNEITEITSEVKYRYTHRLGTY